MTKCGVGGGGRGEGPKRVPYLIGTLCKSAYCPGSDDVIPVYSWLRVRYPLPQRSGVIRIGAERITSLLSLSLSLSLCTTDWNEFNGMWENLRQPHCTAGKRIQWCLGKLGSSTPIRCITINPLKSSPSYFETDSPLVSLSRRRAPVWDFNIFYVEVEAHLNNV
jgi:hypothetical protein